jgi:hypothetical protein
MSVSFVGTVRFRSSTAPASAREQIPPGETEVLAMNPHRGEHICSITGWPRLESGSLNLVAPKEAFDALMRVTPLWIEVGATIKYPSRFATIPKERGPYLYFLAKATVDKKCEQVLLRRPTNPISSTVELYAPVKLTEALCVTDGDRVTVETRAS